MDENILQSLQEQIADASSKLEAAKADLAPINDEETFINSAAYQLKQQYEKQMAEIAQKKYEIQVKKQQAQNAAYQINQQIESLKIKVANAEAEKAHAEALAAQQAKEAKKYDALTERFDRGTMVAPWREWAKDHQIDAGHKIAQDRYVILADPMGLGKTLSSIITADMAEKASKDVTPEHPFLGQEKEVFTPEHYIWTEKAKYAALQYDWPFNQKFFSDYLKINYGTAGDLPSVSYRYATIEAGNQARNLPAMDIRNVMIQQGIIEKVEAHYDTEVINAITRPVGRKVLYFCPAPLLRNVMREWNQWAPHRNVTYIGAMSKAERNFALSFLDKLDEYTIIVNYEAWRRDLAMLDKLIECQFDTIIIDEAHNIKDMNSQAYKGVEKVVLGCKPEYVIPMTGTPILNRPQELFPLLHLVNPQEFTYEKDYLYQFCEQYETQDGQFRWRFQPGGLDRLAPKIRKNFMRRTKDQAGIVLPEKSVIYHELDLDEESYPAQAKARKHMRDYATLVVDEAKGKALQATVMIALLTRLRQIETWPPGIVLYAKVKDPITGKSIIQRDPVTNEKIIELEMGEEFAESQKVDYIIRKDPVTNDWEGLIPDTVEDERVIVFSQFKAPLAELKNRVEAMGKRAVILDGSTPSTLRDEIALDFDRKFTPNRADSKWDVLLANYKAAGVGLNLTAATQLITLDEEWNPGKRDQAWDRIHRIGQTQNITINVVRTKDTIDKWLADIIEQKEAVAGGFEDAMMSIDLKEALDSGLI